MARLRHRIEIMQQIQSGKARSAIIAKPIEKKKSKWGSDLGFNIKGSCD